MQLEGKNGVFEGLNSEQKIDKLIVQNGANLGDTQSKNILSLAKQRHIRIQYLDKLAMDKMSVTKHHQNFIAVVPDFEYCEVSDILEFAKQENEAPFIVILDGLEDPHNLGSIIRVCECAKVHGIIIPKNRSVGVNETVVRTSAGAINHMRVARVTNINQEIDKLKKQNIWVYALELGGENIYNSNLTGGIAIVVGSEGFGVSHLTKELCDQILTLPMRGSVNSLNASVACGVAVFEALRQRTK